MNRKPLAAASLLALAAPTAALAGDIGSTLVSIGVPAIVFGFVLAIVGGAFYVGYRETKERQETIRLAIEKGVAIPPELVEMLRRWVEDRGIGRDERLFRTRNGNRPAASNWSRAWQRALRQVGHEPLRVYDCRHAAATTWLQAGVPLGEVARRLGHSVETLVSTYVGALAGDEALANEKIETALRRSA